MQRFIMPFYCQHNSLRRFILSKTLFQRQLRQFSLRKSARQGPITWASLGVLLVAGGGIMQYVKWLKDEKKKEQEKLQKMSIGKASIGGSFELMDTQGNLVTNKDFIGQWLLIYFGFCHCPDICPDQLEKMTTIIEKIESIQGLPLIQPIYITVDPHRDSPENIRQYLKDFHKRFIGLTGTDDQIKKVCKAYRVYFSAGPKDEDDDYIVDHTIIMYLINPEGNFVEYFGQNRTINEITGAITTIMMQKRQ
ncbi:protein SCO1 homolog, mitochondrial isoform X2 [Hydra vulgaris]|uniref:Protein SCO1 homolog, mitochondrial isoform X2 n=1 Tax=Hydra vulgaris TaxID=6087 RepID=A0ABM4C323_HYDVU